MARRGRQFQLAFFTPMPIPVISRAFNFPVGAIPIAEGIVEHVFRASYDESEQTYLVKEFAAPPITAVPLLVILLHGAKSHQQQGMTAGIYGDAFVRLAREWEARQAVLICPEYRGNSWMSAAAESDLLDIFRIATARYRPQRILLMGGSMGGTSSLIFAARHSDLMHGVLALCPATDVAEMFPLFPEHFLTAYGASPQEAPAAYRERSTRYCAQNLAALPLAIVHGTDDVIIPIHHARLLVEELNQLNAPLLYEEIADGNHDAPIYIPLGRFIDFALQNT